MPSTDTGIGDARAAFFGKRPASEHRIALRNGQPTIGNSMLDSIDTNRFVIQSDHRDVAVVEISRTSTGSVGADSECRLPGRTTPLYGNSPASFPSMKMRFTFPSQVPRRDANDGR